MNSQDITKIAHRAKRETEAFINNYINDRDKGWPVLCRCGSSCSGYYQEGYVRRPEMLHTILTH